MLGAWCASALLLTESEPAGPRPRPAPPAAPIPVESAPEPAPLASAAEVATPPPLPAPEELRRLVRDRGEAPALRADGLRRVAEAAPGAARELAREALGDSFPRGPLVTQALLTLAASQDAVDLAREALALLGRTDDPEVALACGQLLDAGVAEGLPAHPLRRALDVTPLPEGRVALLRALAHAEPIQEREAAAEEGLRDAAACVRVEALGLLSARQLDALGAAVAADPVLRRSAPRALRRLHGREVEATLQACALAEREQGALEGLCEALAARSPEARHWLDDRTREASLLATSARAALER